MVSGDEVDIYKLKDRSCLTTASCPYLAAYKSGVRSYSSFELTSALPVSSNCLTTASCPFSAAHESGVRLLLSFKSSSALPISSRSLTVVLRPFSAAHCYNAGLIYSGMLTEMTLLCNVVDVMIGMYAIDSIAIQS